MGGMFEIPCSGGLRRRSFLRTSSLAVASVWSGRALGVAKEGVGFSGYPFSLGVASGDPSADAPPRVGRGVGGWGWSR